MRSKKELIGITNFVLEYLKELESSKTFISVLTNLILTAKKEKKTKEEQLKRFLEIVYIFKNKNNIQMLAGGKAALRSFESFLQEFFVIEKANGDYRLKNQFLKDLDIDELHYVFGWCRKILK